MLEVDETILSRSQNQQAASLALYETSSEPKEHPIPSVLGRVSLPTSSHLRLPARCSSLELEWTETVLTPKRSLISSFSPAGDVCPWRVLPQPGLGPERLVCPFGCGARQKIDPVVTAGRRWWLDWGKNVRRRGVYPVRPASSSVSDLRRASSGEVPSEA